MLYNAKNQVDNLETKVNSLEKEKILLINEIN